MQAAMDKYYLMRFYRFARLFCLAAALFTFGFVATDAKAHEEKVMNAQVRLSPSGSGAGYLQIHNGSKVMLRLIGAKSPMVDRIEIHTAKSDNGVMRMMQLKSVDIAAGKMVALQPGGRHLMLFGVMKGLKVGGSLPLTLLFAGNHQLHVKANIVPLSGRIRSHKMKKKMKSN
jgi:copper(I)-binding protein